MIVVATLSIILSIFSKKILDRRANFLSEAMYHQNRITEEIANIKNLKQYGIEANSSFGKKSFELTKRSSYLRIIYHIDLKNRYINVSNKPWLSLGTLPKDPGEDLLWEAFGETPSVFSP